MYNSSDLREHLIQQKIQTNSIQISLEEFDKELSWEDRKQAALEEIKKPESQQQGNINFYHWKAYYDDEDLLKIITESKSKAEAEEAFWRNEHKGEPEWKEREEWAKLRREIFRRDKFGLSPIIYAIWGKVDATKTPEPTWELTELLIKLAMVDSNYHKVFWSKKELGHILYYKKNAILYYYWEIYIDDFMKEDNTINIEYFNWARL